MGGTWLLFPKTARLAALTMGAVLPSPSLQPLSEVAENATISQGLFQPALLLECPTIPNRGSTVTLFPFYRCGYGARGIKLLRIQTLGPSSILPPAQTQVFAS